MQPATIRIDRVRVVSVAWTGRAGSVGTETIDSTDIDTAGIDTADIDGYRP